MNPVVVAPELLNRFHELAKVTQRSESEIINEALTGYLAADRHYVEILALRIAAADRGEFASDEELERFFDEHAGLPKRSTISGKSRIT